MKPPSFDRRAMAAAEARLPLLFVLLLGLAAGSVLLSSAQAGQPAVPQAPADTTEAVADSTGPHRVLAYYFHTTQRCATCRKIEAYTTEAIRTGFAEELKDGRLVFQVLNVDEKPYKHFVKDYELFTKSVILVDEHAGTEAAWKNLPKIWELTGDKEGFIRYIQEETRSYLTGRQS
ncbi:MAG: nitrophenyl compound nitroreductase subunit ArsF family protein [Candidatus Eisenbacteria bacterium]|nr:nitrophenyl compound nitroreductase subunit ArsF family protein [Candidatus Eisenbacteria bacterium]